MQVVLQGIPLHHTQAMGGQHVKVSTLKCLGEVLRNQQSECYTIQQPGYVKHRSKLSMKPQKGAEGCMHQAAIQGLSDATAS